MIAMFEGPDRNRNIIIAVVVVVVAVIIFLYAGGYLSGII
jgi:NADH:ubiquinone oxidoreductase subunit 5 (subunit L)/multisubunit Na+/H+ antiporter MnhA subunit